MINIRSPSGWWSGRQLPIQPTKVCSFQIFIHNAKARHLPGVTVLLSNCPWCCMLILTKNRQVHLTACTESPGRFIGSGYKAYSGHCHLIPIWQMLRKIASYLISTVSCKYKAFPLIRSVDSNWMTSPWDVHTNQNIVSHSNWMLHGQTLTLLIGRVQVTDECLFLICNDIADLLKPIHPRTSVKVNCCSWTEKWSEISQKKMTGYFWDIRRGI